MRVYLTTIFDDTFVITRGCNRSRRTIRGGRYVYVGESPLSPPRPLYKLRVIR